MTLMKNILKRYVVRDTALSDKRFRRATIRLTLTYAMSASVILVLFSMLVYVLFIRVLPDAPLSRYETHQEEEGFDDLFNEDPVHEVEENLLTVLVFTDLVLLALIVLVGYVMSRATLRPIAHVYARQKKFVAEAAHELRTPLAVLTAGASYLLARARTNEEYRTFTNDVLEESRRLTKLANDLLFLAQHEEQPHEKHGEVDLKTLIDSVLDAMRPYALSHEVELTGLTHTTGRVRGSTADLRRVLLNLTKNAIDYNTHGGSVKVALSETADEVILNVSDTGVGIPQEELPFVFERFYKVDRARTGNNAGAGLGLAIVRDIVDAHHGRISLQSELRQGTTVTIVLPRAL